MRNGNLFVYCLRAGLIAGGAFIIEEVGRRLGRSEGYEQGKKDGYLEASLRNLAAMMQGKSEEEQIDNELIA